MNSFIRFGVGVLGSVISLLMFGAPILTFRRVIRKRSTEEFSGFPYAIALFNCLIYTWYASPLISNGFHNATVLAVNGIGIVLECCFICIYLIFAPPKTKKTMGRMLVGVVIVFATIATISVLALHDRKHKQLVVGTVGMTATVILYGSPLSVIRLVIRTKSVEFMPFSLSLFAFLSSSLWMVYGALSRDILIMAPNFLGVPLGLAQIVLYCIYRNRKSQSNQDAKLNQFDPEMGSMKGNYGPENNIEKTNLTPVDQYVEMQKKEPADQPRGK